MNRDCCEKLSEESIDDSQVAAYLQAQPDFFVRHAWLLEDLKIPHDCAPAVSLIEYQVSLLRQTNRTLCDQIDTLVRIARTNDALLRNMHELTLVLLQSGDLSETVTGVEECLRERFQLEWVALRLFHEGKENIRSDLYLSPACLAAVQTVFDSGEPYVGTPAPSQLDCFFASDETVRSCALVPLRRQEVRGMLAIGSGDRQRFWPGLGKVYLAWLGEVIEAKLATLLARRG